MVEDGPSEPSEYVERVAKFRLQDFERWLAPHDLGLEEVRGDYCLSPYDSLTHPG